MSYEATLTSHKITFVVDLTVAVDVSFPDHLVDLLVGELFAEVSHHVPQFGGRDETVAVLIEHPEGLADLLLTVGVLHLPRHHCEEFGEVDGSVAYVINAFKKSNQCF